MSKNVYAKFLCVLLRIKKVSGIFRELITTTRRTTRVAFGDPPSGSKSNINNNRKIIQNNTGFKVSSMHYSPQSLWSVVIFFGHFSEKVELIL